MYLYGTSSLTLRQVRVFKNKMLGRIFGPKIWMWYKYGMQQIVHV
jgi:hypothetical protein